jgi:glycosyltransferase involved in cell wall biosynthesis
MQHSPKGQSNSPAALSERCFRSASAQALENGPPSKIGGPRRVVQKEKLHVLLTVNASWNVINFRSGLIRALIADGHRVTVTSPEDRYSSQITDLGCAYLPLAMDSKGLSVCRDALLFGRFLALFRSKCPDVVLSFTIKNNIYAAFAGRLAGVPVIPNVTGLGTAFIREDWLNSFAIHLCRGAFRHTPVVFFQNPDDRALFAEKGILRPDAATQILPGSGIDLRHFAAMHYPAEGDGIRFLYVGRLLRDKGVLELVEAARILRATHPQARVQLLGEVESANRTAIDRRIVEGWVDEGLVDYLGTASDIRPIVAAAHCVVLPSYREGTPRTLLEAGALARPVIATDVPGCRSVVHDGVTGLLCRVRDPNDLAGCMADMIALGAEARAVMGREGRQRMEQMYDEAFIHEAYRNQLELLREAKRLSKALGAGRDGAEMLASDAPHRM